MLTAAPGGRMPCTHCLLSPHRPWDPKVGSVAPQHRLRQSDELVPGASCSSPVALRWLRGPDPFFKSRGGRPTSSAVRQLWESPQHGMGTSKSTARRCLALAGWIPWGPVENRCPGQLRVLGQYCGRGALRVSPAGCGLGGPLQERRLCPTACGGEKDRGVLGLKFTTPAGRSHSPSAKRTTRNTGS